MGEEEKKKRGRELEKEAGSWLYENVSGGVHQTPEEVFFWGGGYNGRAEPEGSAVK